MQIELIKGGGEKVDYPVIGFKFLNSGTADAVLWKFFLDVLNGQPDLTPEFDLELNVGYKEELGISGRNVGWGPANNFSGELLLLSGKIELCSISIPTIRKWMDGEALPPLSVNVADLPIADLWEKHFSLGRATAFYTSHFHPRRGLREQRSDELAIPITQAKLIWRCTDSSGRPVQGCDRLRAPQFSSLHITRSGLRTQHHEPPQCMMMPPQTRYCSILDPSLGTHRREYTISRKIAPGGSDHFQIMVGTTQTAVFELKFGFHCNATDVIASPSFRLEIWHPRNADTYHDYIDGTEIQLDAQTADVKPSRFKRAARWGDHQEARNSFPFLPVSEQP